MKMNREQIRHFTSRVNDLKWKAKHILDDEYQKIYTRSTNEERKNKAIQIMNGTAKIKKKISFNVTILTEVFNFKNLSKYEDERDKSYQIKENKMNELYKMAEMVVDEIMLNSKNAVKLLQDFEVYCKNMKLSK